MINFFKRRIRAFYFAFSGLKAGFLNEIHLKVHVLALAAVIVAGLYYRINYLEWALVFTCSGLVISVELINTAIEKICDLITTQKSLHIKYIKDLSAAAVLITALTAIVVACLLFKKYIFVFK